MEIVLFFCLSGAAFSVSRRPMQHLATGHYIVLVMRKIPRIPPHPLTLFDMCIPACAGRGPRKQVGDVQE